MNLTTSLKDVCRAVSVKGGLEVLKALKKTSDFNTLLKITGLDRGVAYRALERWVKMGIVRDTFDYNLKKHRYTLSPLGLIVLSKLEELENLLEELPQSSKMSAEEVLEFLESLPPDMREKLLVRKDVKEEEIL